MRINSICYVDGDAHGDINDSMGDKHAQTNMIGHDLSDLNAVMVEEKGCSSSHSICAAMPLTHMPCVPPIVRRPV